MEEVKFMETTAAEMATLEPVVEKKPRKRTAKVVQGAAADANTAAAPKTVLHGVVTYVARTGAVGFECGDCGYQVSECKCEHHVGDKIDFVLDGGKIVIVE